MLANSRSRPRSSKIVGLRALQSALSDLSPVSLASEMLLGLAIGPAVPANVTTLAGFITWLREHPERANIGSPGTGTLPHLLEAMLFRKAGVAWEHVAYSGGPPAVTDLLGGQIAALALPEGLLRQHHASGRVRVIATPGPARSAYLPEVASFVEQGYADFVIQEWFAFFASGLRAGRYDGGLELAVDPSGPRRQ